MYDNITSRPHTLTDEELKATCVVALTATATNSKALDLGQEHGIDRMALNVFVPVTTLAEGKTLTLSLESSENGVTYSSLNCYVGVLTGKIGGGTEQFVTQLACPITTHRYIRLKTASVASSGILPNTVCEFFITI